ncbi:hypothetical protein BJV78DRAFT_633389 [Lactifluus subvellereus]|nr:hypothetical protein BJV78DRAFT_633389 [Lactifluus subvellereus]
MMGPDHGPRDGSVSVSVCLPGQTRLFRTFGEFERIGRKGRSVCSGPVASPEWFTKGPMFADWKGSGSLFRVHGKPGSGKSVLRYTPVPRFDQGGLYYLILISSAIIRNIEGIANTGSAHLAYFFFDFKDAGKQDSRALLSSLADQLCDQSEPYFDILHGLYSTHHDGSRQPSDDVLKHCLKDMLTVSGQVRIYLVLDALDECPDTHGVPSPR